MPNNSCTVKVNDSTYYVACDKVDDIVFIDDYLVNVGSSTIYLYSSFLEPSNYNSGYPRIQLSSMSKAVFRSSSSSSSSSAMTVTSYEVLNRSTDYSFLLLIVLLGVMICQLFKR